MRSPVLVALLLLIGSVGMPAPDGQGSGLMAQEPAKPLLHAVKASGEATITAKPDEAEISIGVETHAADAKTAATQNAAQSTQVIGAIKQTLGSAGTIETREYAITPEYKFEPNKASVLSGYRADNTVVVKTGDLSLVAKILDAATGAGANRIQGIAFTLRNDAAVRAQVLAEAAQKARANAEAIASGLNLHVVRVLQAESVQTTPVRPMFARAQPMAAEVATPIQPSSVEVSATVVVTLEVQ